MADLYELNINVNGAPSGSQRLAAIEGEVIPTAPTLPTPTTSQETVADNLETQQQTTQFSTPQIATGTILAIGNAAARGYEQQQTFNGDSNRVTELSDAKNAISGGLAIAAGFSVGGPLGGLAGVAWTAYGRSLENRQLINEVRIDRYQSSYYQERLINDVTKRSR